ncbi:hypothetical protein QR680_006670 [Steinernema hermaphroditum]|uniref:Uncharacterized protein n=1 Tax=Steinernema hermaphroditum TaxID=289476 RepID=A0AA39LWW9_9BILA|nr:hypothetical protein QR680_006670 [Steinernema hermaphroditum]
MSSTTVASTKYPNSDEQLSPAELTEKIEKIFEANVREMKRRKSPIRRNPSTTNCSESDMIRDFQISQELAKSYFDGSAFKATLKLEGTVREVQTESSFMQSSKKTFAPLNEAFEARWQCLVLTFDEQIDLWNEILVELRNGARPSTSSNKDVDVLFWKIMKNILTKPRLANETNGSPTKCSYVKSADERGLEKKMTQLLNRDKPFFEALAKVNRDFYWEWKLTNGLVIDIMGKIIEPTLADLDEKQYECETVGIGENTYRLTGQPVLDYFIRDYPALYVKWVSLMKWLTEDLVSQMCADKMISNSDLLLVDFCEYDVQFTLTNSEEDGKRVDALIAKINQTTPSPRRSGAQRSVCKTTGRRSWNENSLAFKVLRDHGSIRKVIEDGKEEISKIKSWLRDPDSKLLVESEEVKMPEPVKGVFDDLFDL